MKKIEKQKQIEAPKEKVWSVLLEDDYNKIWMSEFNEGTRAETDWIEGHKVRFLDKDGNGIVGNIDAKQPYEKIEMSYFGEIKNGEEELESEMAKLVNGSRECYYLLQQGHVTTLRIECDMDENWHDTMSAAWDKALDKIAELSISI